MKRMLLPPIFVLAALLAFSLWNIRHMEGETDRWREQLQAADRLALSGEWAEALDALWESYDDWSHSQTYLHIVSHHDAVDDAEAMYRRAIAFGETEELSEFHAELSDLRDQLRLIAEMEALNIRNVLGIAKETSQAKSETGKFLFFVIIQRLRGDIIIFRCNQCSIFQHDHHAAHIFVYVDRLHIKLRKIACIEKCYQRTIWIIPFDFCFYTVSA